MMKQDISSLQGSISGKASGQWNEKRSISGLGFCDSEKGL
jgi:hypothetical protein